MKNVQSREEIGARVVAGGVSFRVWAPAAASVDVVVYGPAAEAVHPLSRGEGGYFSGIVPGVGPGSRYRYRLDGKESYPDPASRSQPEGVHGPSEVVDPSAFTWSDLDWPGRTLEEMVVYELHVGTFTPEGTFDGAIAKLPHLKDLGITAIEVMPIASFSGNRGWGYDGVSLYAPAAVYGGPEGFKRLVNAAHRAGLAVILDVVYNHLGPEGNYLPAITGGRFFTGRHKTPWGDAINYDGPDSRPVREFAIGNALFWLEEYHVDGLRLDATHAIIDDTEPHFLAELAERVHAAGSRPHVLIAEDERNDRRLLLPRHEGGFGLDAVWADDVHHQLRRLTAGDQEGYFASYGGTVAEVVETLRKGWYYEGQRSPHSGEPRGTPAEGIPPQRFVHCIQNHDQVGNRAFGDRLHEKLGLAEYRMLSALLLLSPYTPLLWMGQEWGATAPFRYFTDHPPELGKLVTEGRREEFGHFAAFRDPEVRETIPDPQAVETFTSSRLDWAELAREPHAGILALYRELLRLRAAEPALRARDREHFSVLELGKTALAIRRRSDSGELVGIFNFSGALTIAPADFGAGGWKVLLSTEERRFGGAGQGMDPGPAGALFLGGAGAVLARLED